MRRSAIENDPKPTSAKKSAIGVSFLPFLLPSLLPSFLLFFFPFFLPPIADLSTTSHPPRHPPTRRDTQTHGQVDACHGVSRPCTLVIHKRSPRLSCSVQRSPFSSLRENESSIQRGKSSAARLNALLRKRIRATSKEEKQFQEG